VVVKKIKGEEFLLEGRKLRKMNGKNL
jgi:hypothetical protein